MEKRVLTSDGVPWTVRRRPPLWWKRRSPDDVTMPRDDHLGFEALFMVAVAAVLLLVSPVAYQAGHWWILPLLVVWMGYTWFLYLAHWRVHLHREDQLQERFVVRGRAHAARLAHEFAEEIARTKDSGLRS